MWILNKNREQQQASWGGLLQRQIFHTFALLDMSGRRILSPFGKFLASTKCGVWYMSRIIVLRNVTSLSLRSVFHLIFLLLFSLRRLSCCSHCSPFIFHLKCCLADDWRRNEFSPCSHICVSLRNTISFFLFFSPFLTVVYCCWCRRVVLMTLCCFSPSHSLRNNEI